MNWNEFRDNVAVNCFIALMTTERSKDNVRYPHKVNEDVALATKARVYANAIVTELKNKPYSND